MSASIREDESGDIGEAVSMFEREIGVTGVPYVFEDAGHRRFIDFKVGRNAPVYRHALLKLQQNLPMRNEFKGAAKVSLSRKKGTFPASLEANVLLTFIAPSTRVVSQAVSRSNYKIPFIPFQNREDHRLAQPATHIVRGRRGVGKSTLIGRAVEILGTAGSIAIVMDMQGYSTAAGIDLYADVLADFCQTLSEKAPSRCADQLVELSQSIVSGVTKLGRAPAAIKRLISQINKETQGQLYLFLDDFHLVNFEDQPPLLHYLHASLKGANGWLKVAGLSSLLNTYSPITRQGLQVPGDAQVIALDLTLENPEAAEAHLRAILDNMLNVVGYSLIQSILPNAALKRLVWATAGVPRDFLQMFARSVEHARRNKRSAVTLSDVNVAIGEFGQEKMNNLLEDARNSADELKNAIEQLQETCLDREGEKINAFIVRSENSKTRDAVRALSDLRMVHLIHQSITPDRAGERYEAYIIDYSIFTGFRRRPGVKEMVPTDKQFKAADLRRLPKLELRTHEHA